MMHVEHNYHKKHDGMEFPVAFLSHTFADRQRK